MYKEGMKVKNNKFKNSVIGMVISMYIACNIMLIYNLPNMFAVFISWLGNEEVTLI